ncbi:hypothetical protein M9H77_30925 [Catharanthus roseus]|uniref:Uncharacterized protein n=1 Tax=Catharanthus roseus TaxID=4058 RepID=A0ACC0A2W8_CATRO|nr:hypothetical protein M9H77_30925 [Catharanthus roseus]
MSTKYFVISLLLWLVVFNHIPSSTVQATRALPKINLSVKLRAVDPNFGHGDCHNKINSQRGPIGLKAKEYYENSTNSFYYMSSPMTRSRAKKMLKVLSHFIHKVHAKEGLKVKDYKPRLVKPLMVMDQGLHTLIIVF